VVQGKAKSPILQKLAKNAELKKAWNAHKDDETTLSSGGDLPAGIEGGVAQLTSATVSTHEEGENKGKPYMMLAGIVKQPEEVKGLRAMKLVKLYAYGKSTLDKQIAVAMNELRKMGVDTTELDLADLEETLEQLVEEAPHFRFRTWKAKPTKEFPNPSTFIDFRGLDENYTDDESDGVEDDTDEEEEEEAGTEEEDEDEDSAEEENDEEEEDGDADSEEEDEDDSDEEEEEDEWEPEKGDCYSFKPAGAKKSVEADVTAVNKKNQTVTLKSLADNKVYKNVPWGALIRS